MKTSQKKIDKMTRFFMNHNMNWKRLSFILKLDEDALKAYLLGAGLTNKLSYEQKMLTVSLIALMERKNISCPEWFEKIEHWSRWHKWADGLRYEALKDAEVNLKAAEELLYIIMDRDIVLEKNECRYESAFGDLEKLRYRYTVMMQVDTD